MHGRRAPGSPFLLPSGAEGRWTGVPAGGAVVLVDGGRGDDAPGTWSATLEWLVRRLAPRFPQLGFLEVRYRIKSWNRLEECADDARSALAAALERGAPACALVGFSMGGAVSALVAGDPAVTTVIGLAPWLPDRLDVSQLRGRRFAVVHGLLDRNLPGLPGVHPDTSRQGYERAQTLGVVDSEYTEIRWGFHGIALRGRRGLVPLPRARRWVELVAAELDRFEAAGE